ncbi:MAG: ethanolamine ammonia-lyase subunit EutC [Sporocytophaga sp.]|uniref:ethanolamine ammonia-lyase subunit EutC n=1 Tax=Sporocytophaga sp. TaxID=2231183 RepID=UPI001B03CE3E|nr:ethanolamine ammonia-lyase subunit EutC [Sporocytophaga sp.]MBO9702190.1 ethanolamine ammonia-lyase subunit EutC [Sporocytophaga sp.]
MIEEEFWNNLKRFTNARIGLRNSGTSISTADQLKFQLSFAEAKDAVHKELDEALICEQFAGQGLPMYFMQSQINNKFQFLYRPDLGRKLSASSVSLLNNLNTQPSDIAFVICDGLSPTAIHHHAFKFLTEFMSKNIAYTYSSLSVVRYGRVAIGDEIGFLLKAKLVVVLIGERPGLSAPDSMGIYFTYNPKPGLTDESRNCISNIHKNGLSYSQASEKLSVLVCESLKRKISGVYLKDRPDDYNLLIP